jgi:hypothetical protein
VLVLLDLIVDVPGYGVYLFYLIIKYHCTTLERLLDVDHHEAVLELLDLIVDVPSNGVYLFHVSTTVLLWRDFWIKIITRLCSCSLI